MAHPKKQLTLLAELILLHRSTHTEQDTFTSRSGPVATEKVSTLLFLSVTWLHMQTSGQHCLCSVTYFYVHLNAPKVLSTKGLWRKNRSTFRNKHITYVSVEHVVCSSKSDIVDQDLCYCIYSLENQINFLPFSTKCIKNSVKTPRVNNTQETANIKMCVTAIFSSSCLNYLQKCLT